MMRVLLDQAMRPAIVFFVSLAALMVVRRLVLGWLSRQSHAWISVSALRFPSLLWCLAGALQLALEMSVVPARYTGRAANAILVFLVLSASLVAASISVRSLAAWGERRGIVFAASGLARTLTRGVVFSTGALVLLWIFGKPITPLLTALGVSGLAVALALQDTLANFFAGIHILLEEPLAVGQAIRLSENEEGIVTDIGWRTTRIRTGRNNVVVVPNTKITTGILTNYHLPESRVVADLQVLVAHEADPDRAVALALEELRATPGVLADPPPVAMFNPGVLPTHLQFSLLFSVRDFTEQGPALSEARLRILRRFRREGIRLPKTEPRLV